MSTTTTTTKTRTRTKKTTERHCTLTTLTNGRVCLWLTTGNEVRAYILTELKTDFGLGFRLGKADNGDGQMDEYDVLIDGRKSQCECKGFLRWGHCKHCESLVALLSAGKLSAALRQPKPATTTTTDTTEFDNP
jgi:hypothetical protein